jgi:hypothetical protein
MLCLFCGAAGVSVGFFGVGCKTGFLSGKDAGMFNLLVKNFEAILALTLDNRNRLQLNMATRHYETAEKVHFLVNYKKGISKNKDT